MNEGTGRIGDQAQEASTLVDGLAAERISALDRGMQYGDGLFETLAVYAGRPLLWERHM